jgi:glucokinase
LSPISPTSAPAPGGIPVPGNIPAPGSTPATGTAATGPGSTLATGAVATQGAEAAPRQVVTVDLGGTHVRAAVVGADGRVSHRLRRNTPTGAPRPDVLPEMIAELSAGHEVLGAVVGVPGIVDHDAEALVRAPNLPSEWIPWLNGPWLTRAAGVPVSLANDADLAAVGEANFGAGRAHRDVVFVTISTGVGAGVVVNRSLVKGQHSGGEIGHTIIDREAARVGLPCTVEQLGAGPAIARAAAAKGLAERDEALTALVRAGHPVAGEVWNRAIEAVAIGVVNMAWLVAPQVVVIGGGVGNNSDIVLPVIAAALRRHGPSVGGEIAVVAAQLGDDAGLSGGAAWFSAIGHPLSREASDAPCSPSATTTGPGAG